MDREFWSSFHKDEHRVSSHSSSFTSKGSLPPLGKLPRAQLWKERKPSKLGYDKEKNLSFCLSLTHHPKLPSEKSYSQRDCTCFNSCPTLRLIMASCLKKFDRFLSRKFRYLGCFVANHTGYFIIIPILLAFLSGTGIQQAKYVTDPEYLFSPVSGPAKDERAFINTHFSMNYSLDFDPSRITSAGRFIRYIVTARDGGSIMRQEIWDEIIELDQMTKEFSIYYGNESFSYKELCAIWNGKCYEDKILGLSRLIPQILNGSLEVSYPVMISPYNFDVYILSMFLGGVTVDSASGNVSDVKAIILNFWLKSGTKEEDERAQLWEVGLLDSFNEDEFKHIKAARFTSKTLEDELEVNTKTVIPYIGITVSMMILFSVTSLLMSDWVRAKPYMGIMGILATLLACVTAFGILMYAGIPFIGIILASPFLMLGIGVDDMFVMLSAWRRTKLQDPVSKRLGEAYSEAAVSITITTLTDMFSFLIGVVTPFPSVQIFCIYTGTAVFMTYLWQITFFGACLAISGKYEAQQKHAICGKTVKSKSRAEIENGSCYSFWCAGGISQDDPWNHKDNKPHAVMVFFRDVVANLLNIPFVKATVILMFMIYLSGAIYGFLKIEEGLERRRLSRYDSYSTDFYDLEDKYFREYPYRIQVVVTGDIQYGDPNSRKELLDLHDKLESQSYVAENLYTESWIRGWYDFLENNREYLEIDVSDEKSFIYNLRELYLSGDDNIYKLDVKFNEDFTRIVASRFVIQTFRIHNSNEDKDMMEGLRRIAKESPLNVTVYHPLFIYFDQFMLVRITSIKAVCIAAAVMILVSLIFIPNPWCSLWVGFSIISIEVGVVGYMTLWGVNLDTISMINLIMCIGFSVDFSAHISYAYLSAKANTAEDRVRQCLFNLGFPILQGAISTIIGVSALVFAPSYIFVTFFKTVFLVIFFGAIHGILLLPVLLSILGPGASNLHKKKLPINLQEHTSASRLRQKSISIISVAGEMNIQTGKYYTREKTNVNKSTSVDTSSEESSNSSSLSKTTADATAEAIFLREHEQTYLASKEVLESYSNVGYVADEVVTNHSTIHANILPSNNYGLNKKSNIRSNLETSEKEITKLKLLTKHA